jgi:hypothetical protein
MFLRGAYFLANATVTDTSVDLIKGYLAAVQDYFRVTIEHPEFTLGTIRTIQRKKKKCTKSYFLQAATLKHYRLRRHPIK